ncbi:DUF4142 domain-containing protein [Streptomyces mexicanus]|uniref:DUF4142 domain-containing protein n=1 Tax=Streptomyces mexicanus TaxID=178566 RepID=UPI0031EDEE6A
MRPRPPVHGRGLLGGTGVIIAVLAGTVVALLVPLWSYAHRPAPPVNPLTARTVAAPYGPLSELDRGFVTRLRLAGLWELPAGQQAERKGTTDAVRTAGQRLVQGHTALDQRVRAVAGTLGLPLPNEPGARQKRWLAGLDAAHGADYDRSFANTLRTACGRLLPLIAEVRASTQNALVRGLADDADTTVLGHIEALEATGLVDFAALARDLAASDGPTAPGTSPGDPSATSVPGVGPGEVVPLGPSGAPTAPPEAPTVPSGPSTGTSQSPTARPGSPSVPSGSPTYPLPPAAFGPPPATAANGTSPTGDARSGM